MGTNDQACVVSDFSLISTYDVETAHELRLAIQDVRHVPSRIYGRHQNARNAEMKAND